MPVNRKAATYTRSPESRNKPAPYEQKFAALIELCATAASAGIENVLIAWPWVIGDTSEEVVESLSRIADARLALHIAARGDDEHLAIPDVEQN
jgi:hypothetical protein